jgi:broad specificity phosphatase PhoE
MSELTDSLKLAQRLLNEPGVDPDDDLRTLSRQLLRRQEVVERLQSELSERYDGTLDLVHANRDSILRIHEEGLRKLAKLVQYVVGSLEQSQTGEVPPIVIKDVVSHGRVARAVIEAINSFHPMHGESWSGWPEGS